jgi:hypothetical protein
MIHSLNYKINAPTIKAAAPFALGQRPRRATSDDRMANAMNAVRNSDAVKRYMQMYKSGELFTLEKN